jgi:endonuclease/exonuclease/phosphatase family metal-dependent hydrolase
MRLGTFNILSGKVSHAATGVDTSLLSAAVRDLDCDVLALQEVDRDQERSGHADLTAVAAEAMGATHHRFVAALTGTPGATWTAATGEEEPGTAAYGVALLSRFPVRSWQVVRLPERPRTVPVVARGRRRPLLLDEPRVAVAAVVETPQGVMTVASTHLSFLPRWNTHQLKVLLTGLRDLPRPLVLMGDLNMTPRRARGATGMRALASGRTFPADRPSVQLDHVLADRYVGDRHPVSRTVRGPLSDHRALVVDL